MLSGGTHVPRVAIGSIRRLVQSNHSLSQEDASGERPENAHLAPPHLRWRSDALQPPEVQRHRLT